MSTVKSITSGRVRGTRGLSLGIGGIAALLLTLVPASPAAAEDDPFDAPEQSVLTSNGAGEVTTLAPMGASPAGCYGQTDNPHRSGSNSSVHGRTRCTLAVGSIGVETTLWHLAWFGWNPLESDSSSYSNRNNSGDAHPHYGCSATTTQSFSGTSSHWTVEGGTTYTSSTSNTKDFVC